MTTTIIPPSNAFVVVDVLTNGQTVFDFNFLVTNAADLKADYTNPDGDFATSITLLGGTGFTVSGIDNPAGGSITITSGLFTEAGGTVAIYRDILIERENDYQRDLHAVDLNREMGQIFQIMQQLDAELEHTVRVPPGADGVTIYPGEAGQFPVYDGDGNLVPIDVAGGTVPPPFIPVSEISISHFGASLSASQNTSTRRSLMQMAIDYAGPLGLGVFAGPGTWSISDGLVLRNGSKLRGAGMGLTTIKFDDFAPENSNLLQPAAFDMSIGYIEVSDLTLHGNRTGRVASGAVVLPGGAAMPGTVRPGCSNWASMSAHHCLFTRVRSINSALHAFDDCAGGDLDGGGVRRYQWPEGPTTYSTTPSRFNSYVDCIAEDWYDDGFTAHYNEHYSFIRCKAIGSGHLDLASMGFELDDGSLYGMVKDCYVERAARGIIAKNHSGVPCASVVTIEGNEVVNCNHGITCAGDAAGPAGRDYIIANNLIRDPIEYVAGQDMWGIRLANVDGVECTDNELRATAGTVNIDSGIYVTTDAKNVVIDGYLIKNWPGDVNLDSNLSAIRVFASDAFIGSGRILNPGVRGILWSGTVTGPRSIGPVSIIGGNVASSVAIEITTTNQHDIQASIQGFATKVQMAAVLYTNLETMKSGGMVLRGGLNLGPSVAKTIAAGVIAYAGEGTRITIDTEAAAALDDLDGITGGKDGDWLIIKSATTTRKPTLKDATGVGTALMQLNGDFQLASSSDEIELIHNGSNWVEKCRSKNI